MRYLYATLFAVLQLWAAWAMERQFKRWREGRE
jgi:hypothetical protein